MWWMLLFPGFFCRSRGLGGDGEHLKKHQKLGLCIDEVVSESYKQKMIELKLKTRTFLNCFAKTKNNQGQKSMVRNVKFEVLQ